MIPPARRIHHQQKRENFIVQLVILDGKSSEIQYSLAKSSIFSVMYFNQKSKARYTQRKASQISMVA